jgi:hypothetical protein
MDMMGLMSRERDDLCGLMEDELQWAKGALEIIRLAEE